MTSVYSTAMLLNQISEGGPDTRVTCESSPSRIRTYNKPVNSRLLYH